MRFTKPAWVAHQDPGDKKRASIFSVNVHPDGSRIATGGLDAKIRIWATLPILRPEYDDSIEGVDGSRAPPKKLCTLSQHAGPVLCVRWSYSGKWLASGSDDTIIMIWDLDPHGGGKVWGTEDLNVEGWKALKRLPGHESDVTDLAFSPGDSYLASVGLDSQVFIWSGANLELLRKLDAHQGFVKGVCWDPVGQYLATQSDDKSVKIWNTTDWSLETTITQPFEKSPGSTFFRRLSWSPDGAHITASNAMNNNGYVFVAAVISRSSWSSNISLVGHENTVEVSAYNPHIFRRDVTKPVHTQNICSVVALGSDDLSVSVWMTKSARPLIVAKDVFDRPIMDLTWSLDGLTLYACSSDGYIGVFDFDEQELEGIAPLSVQADYLKLFNFTPPPVAQPYLAASVRPISIDEPRYDASYQHRQPYPQNQPQPQRNSASSRPETVIVNGKLKKRIQPVFVSHLSSGPGEGLPTLQNQQPYRTAPSPAQPPLPHAPPMASGYPQYVEQSRPGTASSIYDPHSRQAQYDGRARESQSDRFGPLSNTSVPPMQQHQHPPQSHHNQQQQQHHYRSMESHGQPLPVRDDGYAYSNGNNGDIWSDPRDGGQFTPIVIEEESSANVPSSGRLPRPRTLGGERRRENNVPIKEIRTIVVPLDVDTRGETSTSGARLRIPIPPLKNLISVKIDDREGDLFEGKNSEDDSTPPEVSFTSGKNTRFLDYVSSAVLTVAATALFCAAGLEDGSINIYSHSGRRIMPTMLLDSPCVILDACKNYLMAITSTARLYVWNVKTQKAHIPSSILQPLVSPSNPTLLSATVRPTGSPLIVLSDGGAYSFDSALNTWVKISEARWSQGSDAWEGKQRAAAGRSANASRGVIQNVESTISEMDLRNEPSFVPPNSSESSQWWSAAMTLGHLETRMHAATLLDSPVEYKTNLLLYAKRIADEGFRGKAEELLKELCGPLYWKPTRDAPFVSSILGMQKRDLLKDVMGVFSRSRALAKLGSDWQDMIKKAQTEE